MILDEPHEQAMERVCAIDVAKGFGQSMRAVARGIRVGPAGEQGLGRTGPDEGGHRTR